MAEIKEVDTANIIPSTLSVATSFIAVYLTFRRSPCFALAYAANDVVLIVLWTLADMENTSYLSVIICFVMFLINDLYQNIIDPHTEECSKNDQIVDSGERGSVLPFVNCLRRIKTEDHLYVCNSQACGLPQIYDIGTGQCQINCGNVHTSNTSCSE